jgi:hypothetical protein
MPYYFGADMPVSEEDYAKADPENPDEPPKTVFIYTEPWATKTIVVGFPDTPGQEPETYRESANYFVAAPKRSFFARLLGKGPKAAPRPTAIELEQWTERREKLEKAAIAHALWKVACHRTQCRALGVKRIFGTYDGGGDESFTHLRAVEMSDGQKNFDVTSLRSAGVAFGQVVEDATYAIMGTFGAGEFALRGAVIIDFDACTITDEKDIDVVFHDDAARDA